MKVPNKLEFVFLADFSKTSLIFEGKVGAYSRVEHL